MDFNAFHCKLHVMRKASAYGINKEKNRLTSSMRFFFHVDQTFRFSVGSAPSDYIQINGCKKNHIICEFSKRGLTIQANDKVQVITGSADKDLQADQAMCLDLEGLQCQIVLGECMAIAINVQSEEENLLPGAQEYLVNQFGPLEKIQEGKTSLIFKTQSNKVIKVLRPSYTDSRSVVTRFSNIIHKLKELDPSSLGISEVGQHSTYSLHYLVMKYFPAETLENHLARQGPVVLNKAIDIVKNMVKKLKAFQDCGYVCRNLTPDNIIIDDNNEIKITGFFLVKTEVDLTVPGAQMIIPKYTSPEQITDPTQTDIYADMFSLGSCFYHLIVGDTPFAGANNMQYANRISSGKSLTEEEIKMTAPDIPEDICKTIVTLLSFDKAQRPSPQELMDFIDRRQASFLNDSIPTNKTPDELPDTILVSPNAPEAITIDLEVSSDTAKPGVPGIPKMGPEEKLLDEGLTTQAKNVERIVPAATQTRIRNITEPDPAGLITQAELPKKGRANRPIYSKKDLATTQDVDISGHPFSAGMLDKLDQICDVEATIDSDGSEKTTQYSIEIISSPTGQNNGEKFVFADNKSISIGRKGDFVIKGDGKVSRQHVKIGVQNGECWLIDLQSGNGTYIGEQKITRQPIFSGTIFRIGGTKLRFLEID